MLDETFDPAATADYRQQARQFLAKSREYLGEGDLHQASEMGWGAAPGMAKAVATAQGWEYSRQDRFSVVLDNARGKNWDDRLQALRSIANELHGNYYKREFLLNAEFIGLDLDSIVKLLGILDPLTRPAGQ